MALICDNIRTIKQFADKLKKTAKNLPYSTPPTENFQEELALFF